MRARTVIVAAVLTALSAQTAGAQFRLRSFRTNVLTESYSFDAGLALSDISEVTVPIGIDLQLSRKLGLTISTGYFSVDLTSAQPDQLDDQSLSGTLDTQFRVAYDAVPGKFVLLFNGVLPTGQKTVRRDELSILGAISSDVIGFTAPSLGSGGNVGGGFAGAIPLGGFALGIGATFRQSLSYLPVAGDSASLRPGAEFRLRAGLEGSLLRRSYLRIAAIYASRAKDEVGSLTQNGIGNRIIAYASINQALGNSSITAYVYDVFRSDPQLEATATGAAILPRGNLIGWGARMNLNLSRAMQIVPRFEIRESKQAPDENTTELDKVGSSSRLGADLRYQFSRSMALIGQFSIANGSVIQGGQEVNFDGSRFGIQLEYRP